MIDLRSDTVTKPSSEMYKAMAAAEVGDDVYGDDPSVNELEETVADLLGHEAGMYVPSGTQSNLSAVLTHCGRGDEYIIGAPYHIARAEAGGTAALGGVVPQHVPVGADGAVDLDAMEDQIKPDDMHFPMTRLLCFENTHNGKAKGPDYMNAATSLAKRHGLAAHLDGARIMNAAIANDCAAKDLTSGFDSVSLCLSKGLGAPAGSVLVSSAPFIKAARRWRKMLGGGMRQSGLYAACGLVAIRSQVDRLAEDHRLAARLVSELAQIPGIETEPEGAHTNMIFIQVAGEHRDALQAHMKERGILIGGRAPTFRLVTHRDISEADVQTTVGAFAEYFRDAG
ncbi:MAG: low-specificity L-threonine aldolase [Rhodospirillaceae bacterium]|jgi:threonine aldolase|nr:low-specificity L-threonine aldolase [Rhodospirillaceae bacterium]MBT6137879.1 low-specificity L-threonine aldolase [Rhodospirillaceae bacterium]